ncbi:hypothetical protein OG417_00240 [Actinoallomurus sp. NBC_01490]|uniref:hypothetical protein n=1 Tax=Actinoallomurus sp. NBC_01490 TaxID=2903557 RepID=UPI002E353423|nr:hypothetical protein [Actinoallomurus sp. NBC_01490]
MISETTADDVLSLFNVTDEARSRFTAWRDDPKRRNTVVPHVLAHRTKVLYTVTPEEIYAIRDQIDPDNHALGKVRRYEGERVKQIVDWEPDFAFSHVFHYVLEAIGRVFTWKEFGEFCRTDSKARAMLYDPASKKNAEVAGEGCWSLLDARKAMRWRIGNFYYSFIREIHVISQLRANGVDVQFHPLADALFRVDAWCGRVALSLYVGNKKYRKGGHGRKFPPDAILSGAVPSFVFDSVELAPADKFGVVHLVSEKEIRQEAERLKAVTGRSES